MLRKFSILLLVWAGLTAGAAYGGEADIKQAFQAKFPTATVESVTRTPFSGIYEVVFSGQVAYTDEKVNFVFFGNLYDMRSSTERNLTRERSAQLTAQTLKQSLDLAFKRVRGNGKRTLYTLEDPNCPYCKQLHEELAKVNNVTVYTFLLPILGPDSVEKSKAVWCAKDRAKAWDEVMTRGTVSQNVGKNCDPPLDKTAQLAQRFGVRGTPAVYLADGRQIGGFLPAEKIEEALNPASSK